MFGSVAPRIERSASGITLYFPPLRDGVQALSLAAFGGLCIVLPFASLQALLPSGTSAPYGLLVLALVGGLIAPFMLCGIVFVGCALYMVSNTLRVSINGERILAVRCLFRWRLARRELECSEAVAIEAEIPARLQSVFGAETTYRLVARAGSGRSRDVVVAESLRGSAAMEELRREIEARCGLSDRPPAG